VTAIVTIAVAILCRAPRGARDFRTAPLGASTSGRDAGTSGFARSKPAGYDRGVAALWKPFLDLLPPDPDVTPASEALVATYVATLPGELIALWREVGLGSFGGGLIHFVDPATLVDALSLWIGPPSDKRIPFARSAFGELYYWRDMREEAAARGMTGTNRGELFDINCVDVHMKDLVTCALDMPHMFERLADPEYISLFLRQDLVRGARELYGPLAPDEQLGFVPALALGGVESIECVQKMNMLVHQSILVQL
jgi:hypothetical protein